jgi:rubrerythrin
LSHTIKCVNYLGGVLILVHRALTQKEQSYLQDALEMENLCIAKYNVYSDQCQDEALKEMLFNISKNKRDHANAIKDLLNHSQQGYQ